MFRFQVSRKFCLAAVVAALFAVAGCKSQSDEATNPPANQSAPAQQAKSSPAPAKPATAKPAAAKPVAAKPATVYSPKPAAASNHSTPKAMAVAGKSTQPVHLVDVTVPKGTPITATVAQSVASDKNKVGDSFAASLSTPITVDGKVVLPKGTHVTGRIVAIRKHELKVALASVVVHGKSYDLATNSLRPSDKNQHKASAGSDADANQKQKKDNSTLSAKSQLTFKLAKSITVPVKG